MQSDPTTPPKRIWADPPETFDGMDIWRSEPGGKGVPYILASEVAALIAEAEARGRSESADYAPPSPQERTMTDAAPKRIWVSAPNEDNEVETWTDPDEGGTEYILASEHAAQIAAEQTAWRADPESSEAWCFGNQYALDRLCHVLGVDPDKVDWDGSDGSRDEEADSLINRILRANDDADGNSPEVAALIREAEARGMERAAEICEVIRTGIANGPMPEGARFDYEQAIRAAKATP